MGVGARERREGRLGHVLNQIFQIEVPIVQVKVVANASSRAGGGGSADTVFCGFLKRTIHGHADRLCVCGFQVVRLVVWFGRWNEK